MELLELVDSFMELVDMLEMVQRINYSYTFIFKYVDNRLNFFIIFSSGVLC